MDISPGAWIGLTCLVGIILSSGLVLWSTWRKKGRVENGMWHGEKGPSFTRIWKQEDDRLKELAEKVRALGSDKKDST